MQVPTYLEYKTYSDLLYPPPKNGYVSFAGQNTHQTIFVHFIRCRMILQQSFEFGKFYFRFSGNLTINHLPLVICVSLSKETLKRLNFHKVESR